MESIYTSAIKSPSWLWAKAMKEFTQIQRFIIIESTNLENFQSLSNVKDILFF